MTVDLLSPQTSVYEVDHELRTSPARSTVSRISLDDHVDEDVLIRKLGPRGWGRVHHFRNLYQTGWGERHGRTMSPRAFEAFVRFVREATFPEAARKPSVFLTDRGGIELCWEDSSGHALQVEFVSDGAEFYLESSGQEGYAKHDDPAALLDKLSV